MVQQAVFNDAPCGLAKILPELTQCMHTVQDNADSGVFQRLAKQVSDGFKWLTTARKGRGVLSSMQGAFTQLFSSRLLTQAVTKWRLVCCYRSCGQQSQ